MLRPAVGPPLTGPGARHAALRRDDEAVGVGVKRLGDELLADPGPVGVGGVDQVDAELDRAPQHRDCGVAVRRRLAPDPLPGDAHRAETRGGRPRDRRRARTSRERSRSLLGDDTALEERIDLCPRRHRSGTGEPARDDGARCIPAAACFTDRQPRRSPSMSEAPNASPAPRPLTTSTGSPGMSSSARRGARARPGRRA